MAAVLINGWWFIGAVVSFLGVVIICVSVMDDKIHKARCYANERDRDVERTLMYSIDGVKNSLHLLIGRVDELEHPLMLSDKRENRLCPECDEEKEIRLDDYLCDDCRTPEDKLEDIAA